MLILNIHVFGKFVIKKKTRLRIWKKKQINKKFNTEIIKDSEQFQYNKESYISAVKKELLLNNLHKDSDGKNLVSEEEIEDAFGKQ